MSSILIKNGVLINEGKIFESDILIKNGRIEKIAKNISHSNIEVFDANGKYVLPGCIDDQVHFREPGLTHKANIFTESRAAVAGGITSFMEMPNTVPNTLTQKLLQDKYDIAERSSIANYSFFMGASNDNLEEVLITNKKNVCGVKVFMGSSTGNMLVDNESTLASLFKRCEMLIATHCEDEATVKKNLADAISQYGEEVPIEMHPIIRSEEACYISSSMAVNLAKQYDTRLHILHISTAKELSLFRNDIPLSEKRITAEVCVHHLYFNDTDYAQKGNFIKWNPAVKKESDQISLWEALNNNVLDIVATDHAPHTLEEKNQAYLQAPSGGPLVQHALVAMYNKSLQGFITLEKIVEKMCHAPVEMFNILDRGYLREGYHADIVILDPQSKYKVEKSNTLYKCGWSPFEGEEMRASVFATFVNGNLVYKDGKINEGKFGERLLFNR